MISINYKQFANHDSFIISKNVPLYYDVFFHISDIVQPCSISPLLCVSVGWKNIWVYSKPGTGVADSCVVVMERWFMNFIIAQRININDYMTFSCVCLLAPALHSLHRICKDKEIKGKQRYGLSGKKLNVCNGEEISSGTHFSYVLLLGFLWTIRLFEPLGAIKI